MTTQTQKAATRLAGEILQIEALLRTNTSPVMTPYAIERKTGISYRRVHNALNTILAIQHASRNASKLIGCHGSQYQTYAWSCVRFHAEVDHAE